MAAVQGQGGVRMKQISQKRHQLAEGPFWSQSEQALYWVDIPACEVWCWEQESNQYSSWTLPKKVSSVFTTQSDRLLVTLSDGVAYLDKKTATLEYLCHIDEDREGNRCNDAKCDPEGILWVGTMEDAEEHSAGRLWRVFPDGTKQLMLDDLGISNTFAWDLTRACMYFGDSMRGEVFKFPYPEFKDVRNEAPFFKTPEGSGPDGSTIDSEGCLWNAQWDGSRVVRYSPEGDILQVIELPFAKPTSCVFGGPNGTTLFITSASVHTSDELLSKQPLAGHVIAIELDIAGNASQAFAGA